MSKIELQDTNSGYNLQKINNNFDKIETEFNDKVLYRDNPDGEPNEMLNDLDMNGNSVYNLPPPSLSHEAARLKDVQDAVAGAKEAKFINFDPTVHISSDNVQGALEEVSINLQEGIEEVSVFQQNGTGAVERAMLEKARERVSVKDFGAKGDSTTDDTAAIQRGIDYCVANGGELFFPNGKYLITTTLVIDEEDAIDQEEPKCSLSGEGAGTIILAGPGDYTALRIIGSNASAGGKHSHQYIENLTLSKQGAREGVGIHCSDLAYFGMTNLFIRFFGRGIQMEDCLSSHFERIVVRGCMSGVRVERMDNSHPNALVFISCNIAANTDYGMIVVEPTTFTYIGGSIENNGVQGSNHSALTVVSSGSAGSVGAVLQGVYFEDNAGIADVYFLQETNPTTSVVQGCTFNRLDADHHTINNIRARVGPSAELHLSLIGNGFMRYGTYVSSPSRPNLDLPTNGPTFSIISAGDYYGTPAERPWLDTIYTTGDVRAARYNAFNPSNGLGMFVSGDGQPAVARLRRSQGATGAAEFNAQKSRGSSSSPTLPNDGDLIGSFSADAWSGSDYTRAGVMHVTVDGTPSTGIVPTRFLFQVNNTNGTLINPLIIDNAGNTKPGADNVYSSGTAANRWSTVFANTGTINTSDGDHKQQIAEITEIEKAVAQRIKGLIRSFKFNDSVDKKGDDARIHFGVIAQDVKEAFEAEGLDPSKYALFCYDEWEGQVEVLDDDGNVIQEATPSGSRYGIRYDELFAFLIAVL